MARHHLRARSHHNAKAFPSVTPGIAPLCGHENKSGARTVERVSARGMRQPNANGLARSLFAGDVATQLGAFFYAPIKRAFAVDHADIEGEATKMAVTHACPRLKGRVWLGGIDADRVACQRRTADAGRLVDLVSDVTAEPKAPVGGWDFDVDEASSTATAKPPFFCRHCCVLSTNKGSVRHSQNGLCMHRIAACR